MLQFASSNEHFLALKRALSADLAGGYATFSGRVKNYQLRPVSHLEYEAYEDMCQKLFAHLVAEARQKFGIMAWQALHRLGRVEMGEEAVFIEVAAVHRQQAFLACRYLIDELKAKLPIFKKEVYADSTFAWSRGCHHNKDSCQDTNDALKPVKNLLLQSGQDFSKLQKAKVLLVGAGGLGCPLAYHLAGAGIGRLDIYDGDLIETANLARQFMFDQTMVGLNKALLAAHFLSTRLPDTTVNANPRHLGPDEALKIVSEYDLVIDGCDCPFTKAMLATVAVITKTPLIQASVHQSEGQVYSWHPRATGGCAHCFDRTHKMANNSCQTAGIWPHACGQVATLAADMAITQLLGAPVGTNHLRLTGSGCIQIDKDPNCRVCQGLAAAEIFAELEINAQALLETRTRFRLVDVRSAWEKELRPLPTWLHALGTESVNAPKAFICESGRRSRFSAFKARTLGDSAAVSLQGGLKAAALH
jgi:molybdopterin synthase catalytic subunit/molybdopterin/thiamine biosynthesis adenylyltransferase